LVESVDTPTTTTTTAHADSRWEVSAGPCSLDAITGCISSPNFPNEYGHDQGCSIVIVGDNVGRLHVTEFATEEGYDKLTVNGKEYSGNDAANQLQGIRPSGTITWASDSSVAASGWNLCLD